MLDLMNGHLIVGAANIGIEVASTDPLTGYDGQIIVNSTTNEIKIYYNGVWNTLGITITPGEVPKPETGNPIGLLLALTYTIE